MPRELLTQVNFNATNLNPFCSNLSMTFPISPRCTPSGLTIIKVLSVAIALENKENNESSVPIIYQQEGWEQSERAQK